MVASPLRALFGRTAHVPEPLVEREKDLGVEGGVVQLVGVERAARGATAVNVMSRDNQNAMAR